MTTATQPSTEEVVAQQEDELDAAWAAEAAKREAAEADPPPDKLDPEPTEPQPSAGVSVSGEEEKKDPPKEEPKPDDVLAKIPETERAAIKALLDAERAERERIAAEKAELDHKFRSAQGRLAAAEKRGAAQPAAQQSPKKPDEPESERLERIKRYKEDYPEVAEMIELLQQKPAALVPQDTLEYIEAQRQKDAINQKIDAVSTVHKDFVTLVKKPEFDTWASRQSDYVKRMISSDNPEEVIAAMDFFKVANPHLVSSPSPSASADAGVPNGGNSQSDALKRKREAQSRAVELPANGGILPQQIDEDDEDVLWRKRAAEADARLAQRR